MKLDHGKTRLDLLPTGPLRAIADVLAYGAIKYTEDGWKEVEPRRYYAAALRHLFAWRDGERCDPESGLPHLAHAGCCVLFMLWSDLKGDK